MTDGTFRTAMESFSSNPFRILITPFSATTSCEDTRWKQGMIQALLYPFLRPITASRIILQTVVSVFHRVYRSPQMYRASRLLHLRRFKTRSSCRNLWKHLRTRRPADLVCRSQQVPVIRSLLLSFPLVNRCIFYPWPNVFITIPIYIRYRLLP